MPWSKKKPESILKQKQSQQKAYNRLKETNPVLLILYRTKSRAKKLGLDFNLTYEDIVIPTHCPVLGIPISLGNQKRQNSISVDRIDNRKGYVKGNIALISNRANSYKSSMSIEIMEKLLSYMKGHLNA